MDKYTLPFVIKNKPGIQSQRALLSSMNSADGDFEAINNTMHDTNTQHHYKDIEQVEAVLGKGLNDSSHLHTERDLLESMNRRELAA